MHKQTKQPLSLVFAVTLVTSLALPASADLGDPLPGLTPAQLDLWEAGRQEFVRTFTPAEGVGPLMNGKSCIDCHQVPVDGGTDPLITENNVFQFGVIFEHQFYQLHEVGGPMRQRMSIEGMEGAEQCVLAPEAPETFVESLPGGFISSRNTPPLFGLGLVDALTDKKINAWSGRRPWKRSSILGVSNQSVEVEGIAPQLVFTLDQVPRTQVTGPVRTGRFGWKAHNSNLYQFSLDPLQGELGLTNPFFHRESEPGIGPLPEDCLVAGEGVNDPDSQIAARISNFMALTAPPERGHVGLQEILGEVVFHAIGCADCHRSSLRTMKDYHLGKPDGEVERIAALSNKVFHPYSDFLLHDLGAANDDQRPMGRASGRLWRTTPMWGIRHKDVIWHDGSIEGVDVGEAVQRHGGEAASVRSTWNNMGSLLRYLVNKFVESL